MKLTIEFPEKFEIALDLFCRACEKYMAGRDEPMVEMPKAEPQKTEPPKVETPKAEPSVPTKATASPDDPDDETFAGLGLPDMIKIVKDPKKLTGFRFRAFAKCARQVFATMNPEDNKVVQLVHSINPGGINAILKGKHKDQARAFVDGVIALIGPKDDDIEF